MRSPRRRAPHSIRKTHHNLSPNNKPTRHLHHRPHPPSHTCPPRTLRPHLLYPPTRTLLRRLLRPPSPPLAHLPTPRLLRLRRHRLLLLNLSHPRPIPLPPCHLRHPRLLHLLLRPAPHPRHLLSLHPPPRPHNRPLRNPIPPPPLPPANQIPLG